MYIKADKVSGVAHGDFSAAFKQNGADTYASQRVRAFQSGNMVGFMQLGQKKALEDSTVGKRPAQGAGQGGGQNGGGQAYSGKPVVQGGSAPGGGFTADEQRNIRDNVQSGIGGQGPGGRYTEDQMNQFNSFDRTQAETRNARLDAQRPWERFSSAPVVKKSSAPAKPNAKNPPTPQRSATPTPQRSATPTPQRSATPTPKRTLKPPHKPNKPSGGNKF